MFHSREVNRCARHCASLGVDTRLVIYPNEFHGLRRPSYVRDRYERYLAWYDKYVTGRKPAAPVRRPPQQNDNRQH
jgi:hypothetical protein